MSARESDSDDRGARREEAPDRDRRVDEETEAAAREAGRIGGPGPPEEGDEAERPLAEAGGGVAEGFEQAERDLIEYASHGEPAPDPQEQAFEPEPEPDDAPRGAADHEHSTERRGEREVD